MKIKYEYLESAVTALNRYFFDDGIEICANLKESKIVFGINWPGRGTKDPIETKQFANHLIKASTLCEGMNKRNLEIDWDDNDLDFDRNEVINGLIAAVNGNCFIFSLDLYCTEQ